MAGAQEDSLRLRQLLEKLDLALTTSADTESVHSRGLGSNNLLFMACELLLLANESDGFSRGVKAFKRQNWVVSGNTAMPIKPSFQ